MKKMTNITRLASHGASVRLAVTLLLAALVGACSDSSNNSNNVDGGSGGVELASQS